MRIPTLVLTALLLAPGASAQAPPPPDSEALVREFVEAFNAHDVPRMLQSCAPDIRWLSVSGDKISTETSSAAELDASMRKYFAGLPSAKSKLRSVVAAGPFVSTVEEAQWTAKGEERRQCGVAVYEIGDGKIRNVWYFSAYKC